MKIMKAAALSLILAGAPALLAVPPMAQVTAVDTHMAQSAIMSAGSRASAVAQIDNVPSVGVIRLDFRSVPRFRDDSIPDVTEFRILAQKYSGGIAKLRAALRSNPATREALAERGIATNRVVGVQVSRNGSLRLFLL